MAFKKFTKAGHKSFKPTASIWNRGSIGFSQSAVNEYELEKFAFGVFYYDAEINSIGIKFTNDKNAGGINKLCFREKAGVSISAVSFLKYYKINYSKTKRYDLSFNVRHHLFVIDLNSPTKG